MTVDSLRARKKERTRQELVDVALELFDRQGFDRTTVEEIAAAADVSPRTFFRYFPTKEDALFGSRDGESEQERRACLMDQLRARPPGEPPFRALRQAVLSLVGKLEDDRELLLRRKRVIASTPELRARALERQHGWEGEVADELRREPDLVSALTLRLTVAAATAALRTATDEWLETGGRGDLTLLLTEAFDQLAAGLDPPGDRPEPPRSGRHDNDGTEP